MRALVTGGTSGIGLATAKSLASNGVDVVVLCRNLARGEAAREEIRLETGREVELLSADMASLRDVANAAREYAERHERLDILVNNAGINPLHRVITGDGIESNFAVNHLAPFLLTNLLADTLIASAPARIVTVASSVERVRRTKLDLDDIQSERDWSATKAYGRSKQANILFTVELARRLAGTGVTANSLHPGIVGSNIFREAPAFVRWLGRTLLPSPAKGARTSVHLALSPEVAGISGRFFADCRQATASPEAVDPHRARRLWLESERLVSAAVPGISLPLALAPDR